MTGGLPRTWRIVLRLAGADLWTERVLALCTVLGLSAVLAPLIVLSGLRAGVIQGLRDHLLEDPHAREIVTVANRHYTTAMLTAIRQRPDVVFLVPTTRFLAASMLVEAQDRRAGSTQLELIPTAPDDPLLPAVAAPSKGGSGIGIVLSASAAVRLHAHAGQTLTGRLARVMPNDVRQSIKLPLLVLAVAPPSASPHEAAFVGIDLACFVEDYQNGTIGAPTDPTSLTVAPLQEYDGFRMYARRLEDVPALDAYLRSQDIDVVSHVSQVADLLRIDRNLTLLFGLVAGLGGTGFLVSLGAGLWANVDRKRAPLALMRFLGLSAAALSLFPVAQAGILALIGATIALGGSVGVAILINQVFAGTLAIERPLCIISAALAAEAVAITAGGAILVAIAAGSRARRVEPWEGVVRP